MKSGFVLQPKMPAAKPELPFTRAPARMLQRKCACGGTVASGRRMRGMPEQTPANKAGGESAGRSL